MKAAPALQVTVERFGVSRLAMACLMACSVAAFAGWCAGRLDAWGTLLPSEAPLMLAVTASLAVAGGAALLAAASRLRFEPFDLRWDGDAWHVGPAGCRLDEPFAGRVHVALDLGRWLLLRFVPARTARRGGVRWLALQRRGLERQWPALRATLYSAVQRSPRLSRSVTG